MSTPTGAHVSTLALDVYRASGKENPVLTEHLRGCARCRSYLDHVDALDAIPVPAWSPPARRSARGWSLGTSSGIASLATVGALVAGVVFWNAREHGESGSYVGVKGTPAVQVLVRSGDRTRIWDGQTSIRPGDALALRADCHGFAHVAVVAVAPSGEKPRLFDGACPTEPSVLPFTLVADEEPVAERIAVVLSVRPLDEASLAAALEKETRSGDVWIMRFTFAKQVVP